MDFSSFDRQVVEDQDLTFMEGVQYVYHCHHYNLFHDQTIDDALGDEEGLKVRSAAGHAAFSHLLGSLAKASGAQTDVERLQLAQGVFPWMGHGRLNIDVGSGGGRAEGEHLHYGYTWKEKYGKKVRRMSPADAVASGCVTAGAELALGLPYGSFSTRETSCIAMRDPRCSFEIQPAQVDGGHSPVGLAEMRSHFGDPLGGLDEERIAEIGAGLQGFVREVSGDDRGLVQAFGIYITLHLASYYNQTAYEMIHAIEKKYPARLPLAEALLREAGHVCVFNTFGNIMLSPEWEGMVGPLSDKIEDLVPFCCAVARGLGFGRWSIGELVPGKRLVLRAACDYEAPFYLARYGQSKVPRCYFFQGAALAFMVLTHAVEWASRPTLTQDFYNSLFLSGRLPWTVEQTRCPTRGDSYAEAVVTRVE